MTTAISTMAGLLLVVGVVLVATTGVARARASLALARFLGIEELAEDVRVLAGSVVQRHDFDAVVSRLVAKNPALMVGLGFGKIRALSRHRGKMHDHVDDGVGVLPEHLIAKGTNIPCEEEDRLGGQVGLRVEYGFGRVGAVDSRSRHASHNCAVVSRFGAGASIGDPPKKVRGVEAGEDGVVRGEDANPVRDPAVGSFSVLHDDLLWVLADLVREDRILEAGSDLRDKGIEGGRSRLVLERRRGEPDQSRRWGRRVRHGVRRVTGKDGNARMIAYGGDRKGVDVIGGEDGHQRVSVGTEYCIRGRRLG